MNAEIKNTEVKEVKKTRLQRLKEEQAQLKKEVKERTIGYILAAFSFVAGLAWNEAIKSFIDIFFPADRNTFFVKLIYAIIVTIIIVIISIYLAKLIRKEEEAPK